MGLVGINGKLILPNDYNPATLYCVLILLCCPNNRQLCCHLMAVVCTSVE